MTRLILVALLLSLAGCASLKDKAVDYLKDEALEQVAKAVDKQLEKRGLSLDELKRVTDVDLDGSISSKDVMTTVKETAKDLVALELERRGSVARDELEAKLKAVAGARDVDDLKRIVEAQDVAGSRTLGLLITALLGYLGKQVVSAKSDGRRDAELAVNRTEISTAKERINAFEKLVQKDLDGDGSIGGGGNGESGAA